MLTPLPTDPKSFELTRNYFLLLFLPEADGRLMFTCHTPIIAFRHFFQTLPELVMPLKGPWTCIPSGLKFNVLSITGSPQDRQKLQAYISNTLPIAYVCEPFSGPQTQFLHKDKTDIHKIISNAYFRRVNDSNIALVNRPTKLEHAGVVDHSI